MGRVCVMMVACVVMIFDGRLIRFGRMQFVIDEVSMRKVLLLFSLIISITMIIKIRILLTIIASIDILFLDHFSNLSFFLLIL